MPYYPNVPQGNQRISASQPQIQLDFQQLQATLGMDHVTFTDPAVANWGKHNVVKFQDQLAVVPPAPGNTEINMFNQVPQAGSQFPLTGFNELFIRSDNGGGHQLTVPITAKSVYQPSLIGNSNWFYLPCGLLVKYGRTLTALIGVNYQSVINLDPIGVPYTDTPYAFATQTNAVSGNVHSVSCFFPDNAHLTITTNSNNIGLFWLTIGPVASVAG